jgi:hypothetical protein
MDFNVEMSDDMLLSRLRNEEDHFIERKTTSDLNDCVKTVVAFANSAPIGMPCVLYVGDLSRRQSTSIRPEKPQQQTEKRLPPRSVYRAGSQRRHGPGSSCDRVGK